MWSVKVLTLFPELYPGALGVSVLFRAMKEGLWSLDVSNIRDFALDKHRTVDDTLYGGGGGMLMKPDVLGAAIDQVFDNTLPIIYPSPKGKVFTQRVAEEFINNYAGIQIICGRYEGVDERLFNEYNLQQISMGDYVTSSGDSVVMAMLDCCIRLIPGVLASDATQEESFGVSRPKLLECPHYTKPIVWRGHKVPDVLTSGDHEKIRAWRLKQAEILTENARPDLWDQYIEEKKNEPTKKI